MSVTAFPDRRRDRRIWVCSCGCSTYELYEDDTARCAACGTVTEHGGWYEAVKDGADYDGTPPTRCLQANGSVDFARHRLAAMAGDDDVAALVVIKADGHISTWAAVDTAEQSDWTLRRLADAADLIGLHVKILTGDGRQE